MTQERDSNSTEQRELGEDEVLLVSNEGEEFIVKKEVAKVSKTIRVMLASTFLESSKREIKFPELKSKVLAKVIEYLEYHHKYASASEGHQRTAKIPEFKIDTEMAVDLAIAANYLDC